MFFLKTWHSHTCIQCMASRSPPGHPLPSTCVFVWPPSSIVPLLHIVPYPLFSFRMRIFCFLRQRLAPEPNVGEASGGHFLSPQKTHSVSHPLHVTGFFKPHPCVLSLWHTFSRKLLLDIHHALCLLATNLYLAFLCSELSSCLMQVIANIQNRNLFIALQ